MATTRNRCRLLHRHLDVDVVPHVARLVRTKLISRRAANSSAARLAISAAFLPMKTCRVASRPRTSPSRDQQALDDVRAMDAQLETVLTEGDFEEAAILMRCSGLDAEDAISTVIEAGTLDNAKTVEAVVEDGEFSEAPPFDDGPADRAI